VRTQHVNDNPANPARFVTRYGYQQGELASITYPSGLKVMYRRDATGQITGIDTQAPGKTQTPFVSNLTHTPHWGSPRAGRGATAAQPAGASTPTGA
jgi:YD repeat-containing protein